MAHAIKLTNDYRCTGSELSVAGKFLCITKERRDRE